MGKKSRITVKHGSKRRPSKKVHSAKNTKRDQARLEQLLDENASRPAPPQVQAPEDLV